MTPFYFTNAVNLKENKRYLSWLLIPGLAVFGLVLFGQLQEVLWAYGRVATYNTQYQRPAPYRLTLVNERLRSRSNEEILLVVKSQGDVVPAEVSMLMEGQRITMTPTAAGEFKLMLPPQADSFSFSLATEFLTTQEYRYEIINGPEIKGFSIDVVPPAYTGMPRTSLENNGNIRALKGSKITWKLSAEYTDEMAWVSGGDSLRFNQETPKLFSLTQKLYGSKKYSLSAGNTQTGMEPGANYIAEVFMDRPPQIEVETSKDSVYGVSHHQITAANHNHWPPRPDDRGSAPSDQFGRTGPGSRTPPGWVSAPIPGPGPRAHQPGRSRHAEIGCASGGWHALHLDRRHTRTRNRDEQLDQCRAERG